MRSRAMQALEPRIAAGRAFDALMEAGRYSGHGLTTAGGRLGRRAAAAGIEGAHRTGDAWAVLRGASPPRRGYAGLTVAAAAGCAVGAVVALAVRRGVVAWRAEEPGTEFTQRLRSALRGTVRGTATPATATGGSIAEEPATLPATASRGAAQ
ncbi:hypothetical protein [Actinoplanes sp. NPDC049118]|uniref:hypothetical protein n=1 Tax=Actinoplanes sp. NPDC049118 TaxID=3155769 RepID=UPI0033C57560